MLDSSQKQKQKQQNTLFFGAYFTISKVLLYPFFLIWSSQQTTDYSVSSSCSEAVELLTQGLQG